ncbi:hypothetical protein DL768_008520 [Monosporascus sp. mg162]|nr:hypothetical protein DL768_008520 [Monosporascus sp. mg162]
MHLSLIREANARYSSSHEPVVCVFAGATSGIGASTIERLARMFERPTFYVVGRSKSRFAPQRTRLNAINPSCKIVFLEAEFSLLSHVDDVCNQISASEQKVDLLYMSPGLIPLNGAEYTKEGLETCFVISYYARMRLIENLLPLLRRAPEPRVLSVLNGGKEASINEDDLGLEEAWSLLSVVAHATTMTTLAFEFLATQNKEMTFLHVYPGWVRTDNFSRLTAPESSGFAWASVLAFVRGLASMLALLFGTSAEDCAERQAYYLTSCRYKPGVWRIDHLSNGAPESDLLRKYREESSPERVWDHTQRVFNAIFHR